MFTNLKDGGAVGHPLQSGGNRIVERRHTGHIHQVGIGAVLREQPAMRVPDATADCGDQKQGRYGAHESVCVHGVRMMTSSDDDIKTVAAIEWASLATGLDKSKA